MTPEILTESFERDCPIDSIEPHPDNVNQGDEGAIEQSMSALGFYGAALVQKSTRRIIAGEHRWRTARRSGMATIPVLWTDVDDDTARRIMLSDNETARKGRNDEAALADLLLELAATSKGLDGTGYEADDLDEILAAIDHEMAPDPTPEEQTAWPVVHVAVAPEVHALWLDIVQDHQGSGFKAFAKLVHLWQDRLR